MRAAVAVLIAAVMMCSSALAQKKPALETVLEAKTFTKEKDSLSYRFLAPKKVEEGKKYPLVIFLHGAGERGSDNKVQLKHGVANFAADSAREAYPCYLIAPQCPTDRWWVAFPGRKAAGVEPGALVLDLIEKSCKDLPIDTNRIYITGLSMGGFGTWSLIARKPDLFAAAIPVCGGGDEKSAEKIKNIPIWVFHGDKDTAVKVDQSQKMVAALKKAGGSPKYTEYPGVGHDSWTATYKNPEVMKWLFAQKKGG